MARTGVNTAALIDAIKARIAQIEPGLPAGVKIVPFYDRSTLIAQAVDTLRHALIEEIVLVTLAHIVFLMHLRSILIVTVPLPLAVLLSFLGMYYAGISSNIMSLAGIAIAIGVLVDAGIVVTENAFRFIEQRGIDPKDRSAVCGSAVRGFDTARGPAGVLLDGNHPPRLRAGLPLRPGGKLFHPLAYTKTFAVLAATVIAVTLVPVLCSLRLGGKCIARTRTPSCACCSGSIPPALEGALAGHGSCWRPHGALPWSVGPRAVGSAASSCRRSTKRPDVMPIARPEHLAGGEHQIAAKQNAIRSRSRKSRTRARGPAETSTDPAPLNMTETIVPLTPPAQWRGHDAKNRLRRDGEGRADARRLEHLTMPIINRIDMLTTGIRSEVRVKVSAAISRRSNGRRARWRTVLRRVPGASTSTRAGASGQYLEHHDRSAAAARYGIGVGASRGDRDGSGETVLTTTIDGPCPLPGPGALPSGVEIRPAGVGRRCWSRPRRRADFPGNDWRASAGTGRP